MFHSVHTQDLHLYTCIYVHMCGSITCIGVYIVYTYAYPSVWMCKILQSTHFCVIAQYSQADFWPWRTVWSTVLKSIQENSTETWKPCKGTSNSLLEKEVNLKITLRWAFGRGVIMMLGKTKAAPLCLCHPLRGPCVILESGLCFALACYVQACRNESEDGKSLWILPSSLSTPSTAPPLLCVPFRDTK